MDYIRPDCAETVYLLSKYRIPPLPVCNKFTPSAWGNESTWEPKKACYYCNHEEKCHEKK